MGCCTTAEENEQVRSEYEEAWDVFKRTDLIRPERFAKSAEKVFEYLFYAVALPITQQNKRNVALLRDLLSSRGIAVAVREVQDKLHNLALHETQLIEQQRTCYKDLAKQIQSSIISREEGSKGYKNKGPKKDRVMQPQVERGPQPEISLPKANPIVHHEEKEQKMSRRSVSQINEVQLAQSFERYSLPMTILGSAPPNENMFDSSLTESNFSRNDGLQQRLQVALDCKSDLEAQVKKLSVRVEQQQHDLQELSRIRKGLLQELQFKKNEIKGLINDKNNDKLNEQIIELNRQKEVLEDKLKLVWIDLDQYKDEIKRLDAQREKAVSQNRYLTGKIKNMNETANTLSLTSPLSNSEENNHSVSLLLANLNKRSFNLTIFQSFNHKIQPTLLHLNSWPSQDKVRTSFIIVEEEGDSSSEQKYAILFNLFSYSKVLPSHTDFQAAVGTRTIIAQLFDKRPTRSDLLYTFDPITPNHFAKYIEKKQNVLLLVLLPNGITLGGFAGTFAANNELQESFLFSLSPQREPMKLQQSRAIKRIDTDPAYLNFGNGELKIKARTLQMTSNAGCFQSIYTWGRRAVPIEKFIGTAQRNLLVTSYEIHQLHFDEVL